MIFHKQMTFESYTHWSHMDETDRLPTLDAPLKEGLAALAGPHPVVVPRGIVTAHGTETHLFGRLKPPGSSPRLPHTV